MLEIDYSRFEVLAYSYIVNLIGLYPYHSLFKRILILKKMRQKLYLDNGLLAHSFQQFGRQNVTERSTNDRLMNFNHPEAGNAGLISIS